MYKKYLNERYAGARRMVTNLIKNKGFENAAGHIEETYDNIVSFFEMDDHGPITLEELLDLVHIENAELEKNAEFEFWTQKGVIRGTNESAALPVPQNSKSSWQIYKNNLRESGFSEESVRDIEKDVHGILNQLSLDTTKSGPVKGLTIGSVQSGKTANITGLLAMASHYGYNVFIVLSGTIENLRKQNLDRIHGELSKTNRMEYWHKIDKPSKNVSGGDHPNQIDLNSRSSNRYLSVILKNKHWLNDLLDWLTFDENKMKDMKILVIDDEADLASVNTSNLSEDEDRKAINDLLVKIVSNKDRNNRTIKTKYRAMNYIGYTATPYANILSEKPGDDSLYPKNFISVLTKPAEHFGPQEIFGVYGSDEEGMDVVRMVDEEDLELVKSIQDGLTFSLPDSLKESLAYFISASASLRVNGYAKPLTMLVHTSNKKDHHDKMHDSIFDWLINNKKEVIELTESVWNYERMRFNLEVLKNIVGNVSKAFNDSFQLLPYELIRNEVLEILKQVSNIQKDDLGNNLYHNGLHMCIDNSKYNSRDEEKHVRLDYPKSREMIDKAPLFVVVGGTTLSRGLTLEGLITSYFLRLSTQVDTLMQMGRWFGFRKKYEAYPRIWLTGNTLEKFRYISLIDNDLRDQIRDMINTADDFGKIAPKIRMSPSYMYLQLTSKNKQRDMIQVDFDYTGKSIQTYIFNNNEKDIKNNLSVVDDFVNSLGVPIIKDSKDVYWENVSFDSIRDLLLSKYIFNKRIKAFNNIKGFIEWAESMYEKNILDNWNVIIGTKGKVNEGENLWQLDHFSVEKVNRSKIAEYGYDSDINIKALRAITDLYRDIDIENIDDEDLREVARKKTSNNYRYVREKLGMERVPQLIIYRIDKDSTGKGPRLGLNLEHDLVGFHISIPNGSRSEDYAARCSIDMSEVQDFIDEEVEGGFDENED